MNFRWESPENLWLLVLVPLLWLAWWIQSRRSQKQLQLAFGNKATPFLSASISMTKRRWKIFLRGLSFACLLLALARPQFGDSKQEIKAEGVEIVLLADVSTSMLADDLRPSRLELAKVDMHKLVELLAGNKIGLVAFAGSAALLSPLTTDPGSLKLFIDSLSVNSVSSQGTNFQMALAEAKGAFERGGNTDGDSSRVTKVVVIISDGEDHEPGAIEAAQKMVDEGVRIYALAYGTQKGALIPERDSLGYLKGYKKDRKGQPVMTTVNGEALQALASAGQGQMFFAAPGADYLQKLQAEVGRLEKTQFETKLAVQYDEKFQVLLIFALLFGAFELLLTDRRRKFRLWQGRFEVPQQ